LVYSGNLQSFLRQIIGHVSPEATQGGPIAFVEQDNLIELDIQNRTLNIIRVKGERKSLAVAPMQGGYMK